MDHVIVSFIYFQIDISPIFVIYLDMEMAEGVSCLEGGAHKQSPAGSVWTGKGVRLCRLALFVYLVSWSLCV